MRRLLITGAAGFLGLRLAEMLTADQNGLNLDCLVNANPWPSDMAREARLETLALSMVRADIRDRGSLSPLTAHYDTVFHLASQTETVDPDQAATDQGTRNLIDHLVASGFAGTFVFASSLAVNDHRSDYTTPLTADDLGDVRSVSRYGRAKLAAEQYLREQAEQHGFTLRIVRFGTVFGADPRANGLFDSVECLIARNSPITRLNWPGRTALIHKDDACRLLIALAFDEASPDCVAVFGVTQHLTLQQICQHLSQAMHRDYRPITMPGLFWWIVSAVSKQTWRLERVVPLSVYNFLWRTALITHNSLWVAESEVARYLDRDSLRSFQDHGKDVLQTPPAP